MWYTAHYVRRGRYESILEGRACVVFQSFRTIPIARRIGDIHAEWRERPIALVSPKIRRHEARKSGLRQCLVLQQTVPHHPPDMREARETGVVGEAGGKTSAIRGRVCSGFTGISSCVLT